MTKPESIAGPSDDDDDGDDRDVEPNDEGEIEPEELDDDDKVLVPVRKAPKPEVEKPELKLLPRDAIATYILIRHRDASKTGEILQALKDGKPITADLSMGKTSEHYELYAGAGNFFDALIEDYSLG